MPAIQVQVKPGAKRRGLECTAEGRYVAYVKAPPVDGRANAELMGLVAEAFGCPKAAVSIQSGRSSRWKWVHIDLE